MSWSFSAIGKPVAVLTNIKARVEKQLPWEPEEAIRQKVVGIIDDALSSLPNTVAVRVDASGSQYSDGTVAGSTPILKIESLYGFVE